jgi:hypothetical protein
MTTMNEIKNTTETLKGVKNTLLEMLGPRSDGFERSKLDLLLGMDGMDTCENLIDERESFKRNPTVNEAILEDISTNDCNSHGKEIISKKEENSKLKVSMSGKSNDIGKIDF